MKDEDDLDVGDEVLGLNRGRLDCGGLPNTLGLLDFAVFEGDSDTGGEIVEDNRGKRGLTDALQKKGGSEVVHRDGCGCS